MDKCEIKVKSGPGVSDITLVLLYDKSEIGTVWFNLRKSIDFPRSPFEYERCDGWTYFGNSLYDCYEDCYVTHTNKGMSLLLTERLKKECAKWHFGLPKKESDKFDDIREAAQTILGIVNR